MKRDRVRFVDELEAEVESDDLRAEVGPTEVLTETCYSLISPGTEVMSSVTRSESEFPFEPGYASVDRVLEVGEDVETIRSGDTVLASQPHASHHRFDVTELPAVPVPDDLSPKDAPFARLFGVGMPSFQTAAAAPPATVGVFGLGLIGNLACQLTDAFGYEPVGLDPVEARRDLARRCGVAATTDPNEADLAAHLSSAFGIDGCELILECSGTAAAMRDAVDIAATGGEVVQVGAPWVETDPDVTAFDVQDPLFHEYLTLRSGWEWQLPMFADDLDRHSHEENYAHALALLAAGDVVVDELVTHVVRPDDVGRAYEGLAHEKEDYLGVLIDWS